MRRAGHPERDFEEQSHSPALAYPALRPNTALAKDTNTPESRPAKQLGGGGVYWLYLAQSGLLRTSSRVLGSMRTQLPILIAGSLRRSIIL